MSLYNCKSDGDQYRISKFTNDLDVEASYLTDGSNCDCPAGHRPVCRHRIMLSRLIAKNATAGQWFHNYENQQWIRAASDDEPDTLGDLASAASEVAGPFDINATEIDERFRNFSSTSPAPGEKFVETLLINLLELAKPSIEPLRFDKDYSNSIGYGPAHDALPAKSPTEAKSSIIADLPPNHSAHGGDVIGRMTGTKFNKPSHQSMKPEGAITGRFIGSGHIEEVEPQPKPLRRL